MKIRPITLTILLTVLVTLNLAASCSSVSNNDYPDRYPDRYPPSGGGYPGPGYPGPGGPGGSRVMVAGGTGRVAWNADQNGIVYIYDAGDNRLVFNTEIRRGEQVAVEPWRDRILINEREVYQQTLRRDARHEIAFERIRDNYPGPGRGGRGRGPNSQYPWYREGVVITEGDDRLAWNADQNGQVYVYDFGEDKLVWNGPIQRGQRVEVIPGQDRILIDERPVYTGNLRREARHQIVLVRLPGDNRGGPGRGPVAEPLPNGARRLATGTGDIYIGEAPSDGTIYVYDEDDRRVVLTHDVNRNNSFQIYPRDGYVNHNSRRIADLRFERGHRYSLYFRSR